MHLVSGFLSLGLDGSVLRGVLCAVGHPPASLAPTHWTPVAAPSVVTAETVSTH